jgi:phospholipid/cholesterol/gamma-HCH transport system substrate-binding protein
MDSKINYALVGLFVIIFIIALILSILWLSVGIEQKNYQTYQVYIQESVSGLNPKASVKYRGVKIGYVHDISLVVERPHEVRVLLKIESRIPLKQDTLALLSIQGLTGLAHIELTGGSRDAPLLKKAKNEEYPELKTKPSLLLRLDTTISSLLKNLNNVSNTTYTFLNNLDPNVIHDVLKNLGDLSHTLNILLSQSNRQAITNILHNLDKVTATLANRTDSIEMIFANVLKATENINKLNEKVMAMVAQLEKNLVAIEKTSDAFTQTAKSIDVAVNLSRQDMDYFTQQALPEVSHLLRELQILVTTLRHFTNELERKPNMLLFGR